VLAQCFLGNLKSFLDPLIKLIAILILWMEWFHRTIVLLCLRMLNKPEWWCILLIGSNWGIHQLDHPAGRLIGTTEASCHCWSAHRDLVDIGVMEYRCHKACWAHLHLWSVHWADRDIWNNILLRNIRSMACYFDWWLVIMNWRKAPSRWSTSCNCWSPHQAPWTKDGNVHLSAGTHGWNSAATTSSPLVEASRTFLVN
jgi:hypothetical protein